MISEISNIIGAQVALAARIHSSVLALGETRRVMLVL